MLGGFGVQVNTRITSGTFGTRILGDVDELFLTDCISEHFSYFVTRREGCLQSRVPPPPKCTILAAGREEENRLIDTPGNRDVHG